MTEAPADVKNAARRAIGAALVDSRTGFSVKAGMLGGAYEAFSEAVEAAIMAEREQWKSAAEAAFDEGVAQERANAETDAKRYRWLKRGGRDMPEHLRAKRGNEFDLMCDAGIKEPGA